MKNILILLSLICAMAASLEMPVCVINDHFNKNFLNVKIEKDPGKSLVVSTYSLLTPLTQLLLASQGETHSELLKVIGAQSEDIMRQLLPGVTTEMSNTSGITLKEASKIYVQEGLRLKTAFLADTKALFRSEIESVDFSHLPTVQKINSWVEQQTNNKIKDLLDPSQSLSGSLAILVNAIYFKASWSSPFRRYLTQPGDFYLSKQKSVKIPFMHIITNYDYVESTELNAKLIELPFVNLNARLLLVVPNEIEGLNSLLRNLNPTTIENAKKGLSNTEVTLSLPKFRIDTTTDLKDVLQELGLKTLFTTQANLTNLVEGDTPLYISGGTQKAFIEINEEGTEAAAANDMIPVGASLYEEIPPRAVLDVNRPFYFELTVRSMTLFSGIKIN